MREKLTWLAFVAGIFVILWLSGDGFYRYPCQAPEMFDDSACNPRFAFAQETVRPI